MPYIKREDRVALELTHHAQNPGELNYLITVAALDYLDRKNLSYDTINDILGAMSAARDEFYRRIVVPYEEMKREANGDLDQYEQWTKRI